MIISPLLVLQLNEKHDLVSNLSEREAKNPEGAGLDLRVATVEKITGKSFLGVEKRSSPETMLIGDIKRDGNKIVTLKPGEYFLVTTMETVYSPKEKIDIGYGFPPVSLMPLVFPRTSLQRGGISLLRTKTDPGYKGPLTFGLRNLGEYDFDFELGARMFNLVFEVVLGEINRPYSGQHQGGRVTSSGKTEIQT